MLKWRTAFALFTAPMTLVALTAPARADQVSVQAKGKIDGSCSLVAATAFPTANFAASGSGTATAAVNCNQPFKIRATSANGAIKSAAATAPNFTNALRYSLKADMPLDGGSVVSATCESATLTAGQSSCALSPASSSGLSSGAGIATNKTATLTLAWTMPTPPTRLIAGNYSDTITLSIAPSP